MLASRDAEARLATDVAALHRSLESDLLSYPLKRPYGPQLVVLSGLPGTGKSHFARELAKRVPVVVVGSDRSRKTLVLQPEYTRDEHTRVFAACHLVLEGLLGEGYCAVFDATNLTEGFRRPLYDIAARTGAGMLLVWLTAPAYVVRHRLEERAAGWTEDGYSDADWVVYCRLRAGEERVQGPHIVVDSSADISAAVEAVAGRVSISASV